MGYHRGILIAILACCLIQLTQAFNHSLSTTTQNTMIMKAYKSNTSTLDSNVTPDPDGLVTFNSAKHLRSKRNTNRICEETIEFVKVIRLVDDNLMRLGLDYEPIKRCYFINTKVRGSCRGWLRQVKCGIQHLIKGYNLAEHSKNPEVERQILYKINRDLMEIVNQTRGSLNQKNKLKMQELEDYTKNLFKGYETNADTIIRGCVSEIASGNVTDAAAIFWVGLQPNEKSFLPEVIKKAYNPYIDNNVHRIISFIMKLQEAENEIIGYPVLFMLMSDNNQTSGVEMLELGAVVDTSDKDTPLRTEVIKRSEVVQRDWADKLKDLFWRGEFARISEKGCDTYMTFHWPIIVSMAYKGLQSVDSVIDMANKTTCYASEILILSKLYEEMKANALDREYERYSLEILKLVREQLKNVLTITYPELTSKRLQASYTVLALEIICSSSRLADVSIGATVNVPCDSVVEMKEWLKLHNIQDMIERYELGLDTMWSKKQ